MADDKPDFEHGVYRVSHTLKVGDVWHNCESDLIFLDDQPFVVLEWAGPPGNLYPDVKLALDPSLLEVTTPLGYFCYTGQNLLDPRQIQ